MPSPESNQAAHVAFTATVASALARSVPLRSKNRTIRLEVTT